MSRYRTTSSFLGMVRRQIRAAGKCVAIRGLEDPDDLAALAGLADEVDVALLAAVRALRDQGCTWQVIADSLGVTKAAAWQRFAPLLAGPVEGAHEGDARHVRVGA